MNIKFTIPGLPLFILLLSSVLLPACTIHQIDIQQGNVITQEMLEKLTIGMEKKQITQILGTPLIEDPFHKDRWDYIYTYKSGITDDKQSAYVVLYFEQMLLTKIDVRSAVPTEAEVKKPTLRKQ